MPFCVSCGKENKATAKFCIGCGKAMPQQSPTTEPAKATPMQAQGSIKAATGLTNKLIIGGIALALAVLVIWLLTKDNNKATSNEPTTTAPVVQNTQPSNPPTVQPSTKSVPDTLPKKESQTQLPQTNAPIDAIKSIIGQYYALIGNNDCYSINAYYEPVLENYYNRRNLNRSEVLTDCVTYQKRWPINSTTVDYNSLQVTNLTNAGYLVTYHLSSSLKKIETDDWKTYELFITIHFTDQLKIKSIYEIKQ
jgi:hypothetical protein